MTSENNPRLEEVEQACGRVIVEVCRRSNAEGLAAKIKVGLEQRERGRVADADQVSAAEGYRMGISESRWLSATEAERDASVAAAMCYLICTYREFDAGIRTEGMGALYGYGPVGESWAGEQYEAACRKAIEDTYAWLGREDLAEKTKVKWNGRLKWPAGIGRWEAEQEQGTIELAKRNWPLLIEEEQEEIVALGCCIVATRAAPGLAKSLGQEESEYGLLRHCGYSKPIGGLRLRAGDRYGGGWSIGAPHRIHWHEVIERRRRAAGQG